MFRGPEVLFDLELTQQEVEVARFGSLTLASYTFGPKIDNNCLLDRVEQYDNSPELLHDAKQLIEGTGINTRRHNFNSETPKDLVLAIAGEIGGTLIKRVMTNRGWDKIDYFVDTSASLSTEVGSLALENAGINPETVITDSYRIACAGAIAAFIDSLANPQLRDKRVVICALEPLSQHIAPDQYDLEGLSIPAIFGDDFTALAYNTSDFELISAKTVIIPDGGTIRFKTDYNLPVHNPALVPSHYSLEENGENIVSISKEGVFITIQNPRASRPSEMNGYAVTKFFVPHTCDILESVVQEARERGVNPIQAIMHQPSWQVNTLIQRRIAKSIPELQLPDFILGKAGRSNSSSATALVVWQNLVKEGSFNSDEPFVVCAPGIGCAIAGAVVQLRGL